MTFYPISLLNKQPPCENPTCALEHSASGWYMCGTCKSDPVLGPVWHDISSHPPTQNH